MPNWCSNTLKIEADEQTKADILAFIKSDKNNELIDFDKIIPMPKTDHNVHFGGWYDWCCDNWGTKWNACMSQMDDDGLFFRTPWGPPAPVIVKLSEMFPEAKFTIDYSIEMMGSGTAELKNGETLKNEHYEFTMDIEEPEEETVDV